MFSCRAYIDRERDKRKKGSVVKFTSFVRLENKTLTAEEKHKYTIFIQTDVVFNLDRRSFYLYI